MRKYNEGDIILINGQTWVCELSSDTKAAFSTRSFAYITGNASNNITTPQHMIVDARKMYSGETGISENGRYVKETADYPVIGRIMSTCCPCPMWNPSAIRKHFPVLYGEILNRELMLWNANNPPAPEITPTTLTKTPGKKTLKVSYKSNKK